MDRIDSRGQAQETIRAVNDTTIESATRIPGRERSPSAPEVPRVLRRVEVAECYRFGVLYPGPVYIRSWTGCQ